MASVIESVPETVIGDNGAPEWAEPQLTATAPPPSMPTAPPIDVLFFVRAGLALVLALAGLILWRRRRTHTD